jgi:hypothetical protein
LAIPSREGVLYWLARRGAPGKTIQKSGAHRTRDNRFTRYLPSKMTSTTPFFGTTFGLLDFGVHVQKSKTLRTDGRRRGFAQHAVWGAPRQSHHNKLSVGSGELFLATWDGSESVESI